LIALSIIVFTAALVVGLGGRVWNADLTSGDAVIGSVLAKLGPRTFFVPLFILGVFCAAMSTIDSQLVAISGIITKDILGNILPEQTDANALLRSKFIIVGIGLVTFLISLKRPELVLEMAFLGLAGGTQLVPTYIGQFCARRSSLAAILSIIIGLTVLLGGRYVFADKLGGFDPGIIGLIIGSLTYFIVWRLEGTSHRA
jgi:SSS family solute:Na+ symporter